METGNFHGEFMVELVWILSGVYMEKTWKIKLPDNLHTRYILPTISIIATYYGDEIFFQWKHYENKRKYAFL